MNMSGRIRECMGIAARWGGGLVMAATLSGCMEQQVLISVAPDGSGTVTVTQLPRLSDMMKQEAAKAGKPARMDFPVESVAKWSTVFTGSLTLVSATSIADSQGGGIKAVFSFADIRKLKVPTGPLMENMGAGTVITFKMIPERAWGKMRLTAMMPPPTPKATSPDAKDIKTNPQEEEKMLTQIRGMAGTFKSSIIVEPTRPVTKTTSKFASGNKVTLLQLDYGEIFNSKGLLDAKTKAVSLDQTEQLNKLPGCKVSKGEVEIVF